MLNYIIRKIKNVWILGYPSSHYPTCPNPYYNLINNNYIHSSVQLQSFLFSPYSSSSFAYRGKYLRQIYKIVSRSPGKLHKEIQFPSVHLSPIEATFPMASMTVLSSARNRIPPTACKLTGSNS